MNPHNPTPEQVCVEPPCTCTENLGSMTNCRVHGLTGERTYSGPVNCTKCGHQHWIGAECPQSSDPTVGATSAFRNFLGRLVREAWVRWARTQPCAKPKWLDPWETRGETDKEADRQIGEAIWGAANAEIAELREKLESVKKERDEAIRDIAWNTARNEIIANRDALSAELESVKKERDLLARETATISQCVLDWNKSYHDAELQRDDALRANRLLLDQVEKISKERDAANFPHKQATECGKCGVYKHAPWRDDVHGYGYVCATCLTEIYEEDKAAMISEREEYKLRIEKLLAQIDLNRDEFLTIAVCPGSTSEIKGICERSQKRITQNVPVVAQRDSAIKLNHELRRDIDLFRAENAALKLAAIEYAKAAEVATARIGELEAALPSECEEVGDNGSTCDDRNDEPCTGCLNARVTGFRWTVTQPYPLPIVDAATGRLRKRP